MPCTKTSAGVAQCVWMQRPLPFELTPEQRSSLQLPYKGSLSFAIHSHHVAGPEAVQAVLHNLLMLYSFLDMQVCSFKVLNPSAPLLYLPAVKPPLPLSLSLCGVGVAPRLLPCSPSNFTPQGASLPV